MMGGTISYPFIVAPKLCIPDDHPARGSLVSTIFFVSGIGTLLQTTFGVRLPIIQGSTFSFIVPIIAIMSLPQWECPSGEKIANFTNEELDALWKPRMREVVLTIAVMWFLCWLLTVTNATSRGNPLRTDHKTQQLYNAPWVRVPYPFQWGVPTFSLGAIIGIFAGVIVSSVESVGDYHACARLAAVSTPPLHAINRGIAVEGLGCIIAAICGAGCGLTSYSENIGAISITKVASRRVIQTGAALMLVFGCLGKVGGLFVSIPEPIIGGIFMVMFSIVSAVGLSNLQFVDLNSSRNIFVLGASLFLGLCIPSWMANNTNVINLGNEAVTQVITILLSTSMFVGGFVGLVLDNTIPGTAKKRGLASWDTYEGAMDDSMSDDQILSSSTYDPPFTSRLPNWTKRLPFMPGYGKRQHV
ncbi:solute carrier family 23 member 2-like [Tropilaelaps mercedesae]|uniref:Solute carrier family 23 member 2-like n=1 Tax=Tropilaelaps mercedesae TaxID=418985 RepID=A0A1V9XWX6_9ACAR|nr:solute carrier family 23 member 2-like [Tropilaelaps mercedesae]